MEVQVTETKVKKSKKTTKQETQPVSAKPKSHTSIAKEMFLVGATMSAVKVATGSPQYCALKALEKDGYIITRVKQEDDMFYQAVKQNKAA
jgi:hypothetical protein